MPYRCTSYVCPDGVTRTDCVTVIKIVHGGGDDIRCGKPMVGVIPFVGHGWMRCCEECFALFTHNLEEQLGVRF